MAAYDRSTILPYQLEPTSTVADSESDTMNSYCSSDSDSCAAMSTENVVGIRAGNIDWCKCHRKLLRHGPRPYLVPVNLTSDTDTT